MGSNYVHPALAGLKGKKKSGSSSGSPYVHPAMSGQPTSPIRYSDIAQQVADLTALQQQTGAPAIEDDSPGFLARTIDVLSGLNFGIAGAVEEAAQGNGPGAMVGRFATELYSSARSLPFGQILPELGDPQKKAFGEVLEGLGYGTKTLGDWIPMLEGTFVGELVNTRGTAGLALDVLTDPLTYFHFGASAVARRSLSQYAKFGLVKGVNKKGQKMFSKLLGEAREKTPGLTEDAWREIATKNIIELGDDTLFDPGGIKFAGLAIPGTAGMPKRVMARLGKPLTNFMNRTGNGRTGVRTAQKMLEATSGFMKVVRNLGAETFDPFYKLRGMTPAQVQRAEQALRKGENGGAMLQQRYFNRINGGNIPKFFKQATDEDLIRWGDGIEANNLVPKNELEKLAADEYRGIVEEWGALGLKQGIFDEAQLKANPYYFVHTYMNELLDDLPETWLAHTGRGASLAPGTNHSLGKMFKTLKDAREITRRLEKTSAALRGAGVPVALEKELLPNYNPVETLLGYAQWFSRHSAMRTVVEEIGEDMGWDMATRGEIAMKFLGGSDYITNTHKEWEDVYRFFEGVQSDFGIRGPRGAQAVGRPARRKPLIRKPSESVKDFEARKAAADFASETPPRDVLPGLESVPDPLLGPGQGKLLTELSRRRASKGIVGADKRRFEGLPRLMGDARKHLDSLKSPHAQRQFLHELLVRTESLSQFDEVFHAFKDKIDLMPKPMNALLEGTAEDALRVFGDKANYVRVGANSIWGKKEKLVPRQIVEMVEGVESNILNSSGFDGVRKAMDAWTATQNMFKTSVYPIWLPSHVRNAMSNVFFNGLRMGIHALSPRLHNHSVRILAGLDGFVMTTSGRRVAYEEIRSEFAKRGILASGRDILEVTGKGRTSLKKQPIRKAIGNVVQYNENESRLVLGVQDVIDDLSYDQIAEDVGETLFNYNEIAPIHRFIQNFVPFTTFTIKNIKAQVNALRRTPGLVGNQLKPFRGRHSENESMVKWESEGLKLRLNKDGKTVVALTGIDLPMRNMDVLWAGGVGSTGRKMMGMINPLLKAPLEGMTGRSFFTGGDLDRATSATAGRLAEHLPQPMKNWLGYDKVLDEAGRPTYSFDGNRFNLLVRSFVFSRFISTSDRQFREYLDDGQNNIAGSMIDVLTGLRLKDMDLDEQQTRKLYRRRRELVESLRRRGALRPFEVPGKVRLPEGTE